MAWDKSIPDGSAITPSAATVQITSNWDAIERWWDVEHYTFTNTLSGMHRAGVASTIPSGTYAEATGISTPGTGALWWASDTGVLMIYRSTNEWKRLTQDHYSRIHLSVAGSINLAAASWTEVTYDTETLDSISEYAFSTNTIRLSGAGYYYVSAKVLFPADGLNYSKAIAIYKGPTALTSVIAAQNGGYGPRFYEFEVVDIIKVDANDQVQIKCYNGHSAVVTVSDLSLKITRLS